MTTSVTFADLVHRGLFRAAIPLGIGLISAYSKQELGDRVDIKMFKHGDELVKHIESDLPKIACFSNYIWNKALAYAFAEKIKSMSPETIIIFGGPNYPTTTDQQRIFLEEHPAIDFYVFRDGEKAFVGLFEALEKHGFDVDAVKSERLVLGHVHYLVDGDLVQGPLQPATDLNELPSPYLNGLCDDFLEQGLVPLMVTARGCPFKCTFCQEGDKYFSKVRDFYTERVKGELRYISERTRNPRLMLADSNFGMYKRDLEISEFIGDLRRDCGWPRFFEGIGGKNIKERVLQVAKNIAGNDVSGGAVTLHAAIQSGDESVLQAVKRDNVSQTAMIELAKAGEKLGASSFSEIILCLPGDTKKSHFKTLLDMIDADINLVRSHQFIMLDGSESCTPEARKEFGMTTRYRVMPGTTEFYELRGESFCAPEIDEICIANSTMSFDHYLDCRLFNLTVEIFYNDGVFDEILSFLRMKDVKISSFVMRLYERFQNITGPLKEIHDDFLRETQELWETKAELDQFLAQPGIPEKHQNGELGNNEQLTYRALAIFTKMDALHEMTFAAAREILTEIGEWTEGVGDYLNELLDYSLLRKNDMLTLNDTAVKRFHFDFVEMENKMFGDTHTNYYKPEGIEISFIHSNEQNEIIERYKSEYGMDKSGMAKMIGGSNHAHVLYRQIGYS